MIRALPHALVAVALASTLGCKPQEKKAPAETPPAAAPTPAPAATPPAEAPASPPAEAANAMTGPASSAEAILEARSGSKVTGSVRFKADGAGKVAIDVAAEGLTPGEHGIHIHEKGDCSAPDGKSAGDHFNPDKVDHGAPAAMPHHAGDFGNLTAGPDGKATMTVTVDFVSLDDGPRSAIGRAIVIHEKPDDLKTQPSGNAGARIACGVITAAK
jgi:Cu-Zn family superoxide dismutase